jgi:hypothetical protein
MPEALALPAAALLLLAGFAVLALAQQRHRERVRAGSGPAAHAALRVVGGSGLALASLALCIAGEGVAFGALAWIVLLGLAALAIALCLAWCPLLLRPLLPGRPGGGRTIRPSDRHSHPPGELQ